MRDTVQLTDAASRHGAIGEVILLAVEDISLASAA